MLRNALAQQNSSEEKCSSEDSVDDEKIIDIRVTSWNEEEKDIEQNQEGINIVPSIGKVFLKSQSYYSDY